MRIVMVQRLKLAGNKVAKLSSEEVNNASCVTVVPWGMLRLSCSASSAPYSANLAKRRQT